jgi:hypothetical protein
MGRGEYCIWAFFRLKLSYNKEHYMWEIVYVHRNGTENVCQTGMTEEDAEGSAEAGNRDLDRDFNIACHYYAREEKINSTVIVFNNLNTIAKLHFYDQSLLYEEVRKLRNTAYSFWVTVDGQTVLTVNRDFNLPILDDHA